MPEDLLTDEDMGIITPAGSPPVAAMPAPLLSDAEMGITAPQPSPWEANAARIQRRYPTREPHPLATAASEGKALTWADLAQPLLLPGQVAQGALASQPDTPGVLTEEDVFRQDVARQKEIEGAAGLGLIMIGGRSPFAKPGELGVAGGKLTIPAAAPEPLAPPFYSAVERAINEVPQEKAAGGQWLGMIRNKPGVKPEEMQWLGLEDWLKGRQGPVSKQEIGDYVRANQIEVREVTKGETPPPVSFDDWYRQTHVRPFEEQTAGAQMVIREAYEREGQHVPNPQAPKFSSYVLPGGENYREMLLTLPRSPRANAEVRPGTDPTHPFDIIVNGQVVNRATSREAADQILEREIETYGGGDTFKSSHWDEPNVLAHVRFNDRVVDGKKTLFLEELQSDWHQVGKRKGYQPRDLAQLEARRQEIEGFGRDATPEQKQEWADIMNRLRPDNRDIEGASRYAGVPDAPFKTTWPELSLKRMIRYAAENGYEKIAWTPGEVQAARYDLSKQVDRINWARRKDGTYDVTVWPKVGEESLGENPILTRDRVSANDLADIIGKEPTDKIEKSAGAKLDQPNHVAAGELSGEGLKVGGAGMKGFYDDILPKAANKIVKKYGAKVEESTIGENPDKALRHELIRQRADLEVGTPGWAVLDERITALGRAETGNNPRVHTLTITPDLRKSVLTQGFPQFNRGGRIHRKGKYV